MSTTTSPVTVTATDFEFRDGDKVWQFWESEEADITGWGHVPADEFCDQVLDYDRHMSGDPSVERHDPGDVSHAWVIAEGDQHEPDTWRVRKVPEGTRGAFPVTLIWGVR